MRGGVDVHVHAMPFINESVMMVDAFELSRMAVDNPVKLLKLDESDDRPETNRDELGN